METKELDETLELHPLDEKTPEQAYGNYSVLRSECPVFRSEKHGGYYVLSKLEDVKEAARNHTTFASAHGHMPAGEDRPKSPPIDYDPPEHTAWRKFFAELVSAPSARRMEPHIQRITNELLDPITSLGQCDLVPSFTNLLPLLTLGHLVGLAPEEARHVGELSHRLFSSNQLTALESRTAARSDLIDFGMSLVEGRRRQPQDDWLSELAQSTIDGRPLSAEEISSCLTAIFQAGHHTTASTLAGLLYHVASQPSLRDRLVSEPDLIRVAVEEAIRVETPLHVFPRYVTMDAKIGGVDIPRGSGWLAQFWQLPPRQRDIRRGGSVFARSWFAEAPGIRVRHPHLRRSTFGSNGTCRCSADRPGAVWEHPPHHDGGPTGHDRWRLDAIPGA